MMKKFFRFLGITILLIILVPLIAGLFVNGSYEANKEIVIEVPAEVAFDYMVMLKNQSAYSVWGALDSEMRTDYRGTDGTVGFVYSWESDQRSVGKGEQEITGIKPGERIDYEVRFFKPLKAVSSMWVTFKSVSPDSVKIVWGMSGSMPYPMNASMILMDMEEQLGADLETGLVNLKRNLESRNI